MKLCLFLPPGVPEGFESGALDYALAEQDGRLVRRGHARFADLPAARAPIALLDPGDASLACLALPRVPHRRLAQAAEAALEEHLLAPGAPVSFALGPRTDGKHWLAAIADAALVARARAGLARVGIGDAGLAPATAALAEAAAGWTVYADPARACVRFEDGTGLALDPSADAVPAELRFALRRARPAALRLCIEGQPALANTIRQWARDEGLECASTAPRLHAADLPEFAAGINGGLAPRARWREWRWPIALATAALLVHAAALAWQTARLHAESRQLRSGMQARFSAAFPEVPLVVDPVKQAAQRVGALRARGGGDGEFVSLLDLARTCLATLPAGGVRAAHYEGGALRLDLRSAPDERQREAILGAARRSGAVAEFGREPTQLALRRGASAR